MGGLRTIRESSSRWHRESSEAPPSSGGEVVTLGPQHSGDHLGRLSGPNLRCRAGLQVHCPMGAGGVLNLRGRKETAVGMVNVSGQTAGIII